MIQEFSNGRTPESLVETLRQTSRSHGAEGIVLLRTSSFDSPSARYSLVAANPFLTFRSFGSHCAIMSPGSGSLCHIQFGNPWQLLESLMSRFELLDAVEQPFPLGGCFGFWGYDLKNFTEPKLPRRAEADLELPDCHVAFYDSLVVFDHQLNKTFIVSNGLSADGSRTEARARRQAEVWAEMLRRTVAEGADRRFQRAGARTTVASNFSRTDFIAAVARAQDHIRLGEIYQVNLSQRLTAESGMSGWELFERLTAVSPAPFSAFLDCGDFQIVSSSPEQFLQMSGRRIATRPIKGTRPRGADAIQDAQLAHELQISAKEQAELLMITDLMRNDLGRICEFGSVRTPELARLERFAQVQHLVSTVEGRLKNDVTHPAALASCFPGGSITGAPKFRAMQVIDELEPITRGPYCGCHGYLGFNRQSQLSVTIRTAIRADGRIHFNVGAGVVADSDPEAEYEETLAKAAGFLAALDADVLAEGMAMEKRAV